jgi:Zn-dependent protease
MDEMDIVLVIGWYLVFVISVILHEAAHAWSAKKLGDPTAYAGGQVSLNPWPHMRREPFGMVILPILSAILVGFPFGYASTPYDPYWAHEHPKKAAWMSAAGPAANLILVAFSLIVIKAGMAAKIFATSNTGYILPVDSLSNAYLAGVAAFFSMLFVLNLILVILNLIPLPPLDGSNLIMLFLKDDAARSYKSITSNVFFSIAGLLAAWWIFPPIFNAIYPWIIRILYLK